MKIKKEKDLNLLRDYSTLFTRSEVLSMIQGDFSLIDIKINRHLKSIPNSAITTYSRFLKHAYSVLEKSYQNEYIFKNLFLTNWLLKELGKSDSVVFNEFKAGNSIADLAMFNGISKAFEIKTEFDTDFRLQGQINDYKQVFNETYLLIPESKLNNYKKYDDAVGIIIFDESLSNKFEVYRKPIFQHNLNPTLIMEILKTKEYKAVVEEHYGELPKMNSFNQYKICFELIKTIPVIKLNNLYLHQIKKRKQDKVFSTHHYKELNQICLALKLRRNEKMNLIKNLKQPIYF